MDTVMREREMEKERLQMMVFFVSSPSKLCINLRSKSEGRGVQKTNKVGREKKQHLTREGVLEVEYIYISIGTAYASKTTAELAWDEFETPKTR
jgi:hypothetical protein